MESGRPGRGDGAVESLRLRLLGPLAVGRGGAALSLPASRKARALLAYLALAPRPVARGQLCDLLWDGPADPRGELRWCLCKLRGLLDEPGRRRVHAGAETVRLDLADCHVDAVEVARAAPAIGTLAPEGLRTLAALFAGDFLDGLEADRCPAFGLWLAAQRRRFRELHAALLERLVGCAPDDEVPGLLARWLELAPFKPRAHGLLLRALARSGRVREAEEHLAATARLFGAEGLDAAPLRDAWRAARADVGRSSLARAAASAMAARMAGSEQGDVTLAAARRASVAVMPFVDPAAAAGGPGGFGDALAHDVIARLAKLRCLAVIAPGSVFALRERGVGPGEAGGMLDVDYVAGGSVRRRGRRVAVTVELAEARTSRIIWADVFDRKADDAFLVLDEIGDRIVAAVAAEVERTERDRAVLRPPDSLDAWEAYHRGLWHAYRYKKPDNERAQHFFATAVRLDPTFAGAHAGLSFAHFQNAFHGWAERGPESDRAFAAAGQSLLADERDPAAHWAMGRALWLRGRHDPSIVELERAIDLSPNFALGHYGLALVHSKAGDPGTAIASADRARELSPFDPLLFAMLGVRAMALVRLGRFAEAADWGVKATARPNAHPHIRAIAALALALAGRLDEAGTHLAAVREALPRYRVDDSLSVMRFAPEGEALFREGARRLGMG